MQFNFVLHNFQVQYKNPDVQIATFTNITPTPFISCYLEDGKKVIKTLIKASNGTDSVLNPFFDTLNQNLVLLRKYIFNRSYLTLMVKRMMK